MKYKARLATQRRKEIETHRYFQLFTEYLNHLKGDIKMSTFLGEKYKAEYEAELRTAIAETNDSFRRAAVKYPSLKTWACERAFSSSKPVAITDFSFHRGWYPIPLHEGHKLPYARCSKPRCGRGQVSNHTIYNGTDVQTTSV